LDPGNVENIQHEWRLVDLFHDGEELGIDVLESGTLDWQEMFDVGTARKDAFKVDPLSLYIDPDI
jgi:methionine synthase II (cobalamin-independent)